MEYRLRDYMERLTNPTLAPYAKQGECLVRVTAKAPTREAAEEMMKPVIERVLAEFGDLAYAVDGANLAEFTVRRLLEEGVTLACAESCTGGELQKRVTDIPGASAALLGGVVVYTNEAKERLLGVPHELLEEKGAVSREVAAELARRVREKLGSGSAWASPASPARMGTACTRWGRCSSPCGRERRLGAGDTRPRPRPRRRAALCLPARPGHDPPPPRRPQRGIRRSHMRLYLARHGESEGNVKRLFYGVTDLALTERGRTQARELGKSSPAYISPAAS